MKGYLEFKDSYSATAVDQLNEWIKNHQSIKFKVVSYAIDTDLCSRILVEVAE